MLKKQAPGETILKVGGMLLLFLGVLLAFGSGNTLSLVMKGSSDSAVVEYLNQNGMTYSQLVASNVMVLVAGVIYLAAGVVGACTRSERADEHPALLPVPESDKAK